jgi:pyrroloquinoline quinone biosynthesis protein D
MQRLSDGDFQRAMIDLTPKPTANVETEVVDLEVLLYHPGQTRAVYLNPTAAVVWGLCDGNRSVREIIQQIGEWYPEAAANLADDVLVTLKELEENGVLVVG